MDILNSIFLGIVEGLTEFLPISSTGHLVLAQELFPLGKSVDFSNLFTVVVQAGAILAVIIYFIKDLWPLQKSKGPGFAKSVGDIWLKTIVASIPAALVGIILKDKIEQLLEKPLPIIIALIGWGIAIIIIEQINRKKSLEKPSLGQVQNFTWPIVIGIGLFQLLALWPGTSRSAVTILGAIILGAARPAAAKFSFFLSIPIILGASGLSLVKYHLALSSDEIMLLAFGTIASFFTSLLVIAFFMKFIQKHTFAPFGWYRIAFGTVLLVLLLTGLAFTGKPA